MTLQMRMLTDGTMDTNPGAIQISRIPAAVGANTVKARRG